MTDHGIVVPVKIMASDIDSFNRSGVGTDDIDNGWVAQLLSQSTTGQKEVWAATKPASGAGLKNLWMAYSPSVVEVVSGSNVFKGIDNDPAHFYNITGEFIDFFFPQVGDIITLTAEALAGTKQSGSYTHVVATDATYLLTWATGAVSGLSLAWLETTFISKPTGAIGESQHVTAWKFQVSAIA
jgi:hypothetical protein